MAAPEIKITTGTMVPGPAPTDKEIAARVSRGAALLDDVQPGWARRINTARLDMDSCAECILGQLYGSFSVGLDLLKRSFSEDPIPLLQDGNSYGFDIQIRETIDHYDLLAAAWRAAIRARTSPGPEVAL